MDICHKARFLAKSISFMSGTLKKNVVAQGITLLIACLQSRPCNRQEEG